MKTIITIFFFFVVTATFSQSTDYHSDVKIGKKAVLGEWYSNKPKEDNLTFSPSTIAYAKTYREVIKALAFYYMKFEQPSIDMSVISSICESIADFENMSNTIILEMSEVSMVWKNELAIVVMLCNKDGYGITIKEL